MLTFTDQTGYGLKLERTPQRIISIVPSQTEFLWDLGLKHEMVGITRFCIHPEEMFRSVERVGGTKKLDLEKIRALRPDLIIANKEENDREQIVQLRKEFTVWTSDINTFEDALGMMSELGDLTGKAQEATVICERIKNFIPKIKTMFDGQKVLYFIWKNPYMVAAGGTFIDHVLNHTGLINCASKLQRYPELTIDSIRQMEPDYCLLSSEPYPFKEEHVQEMRQLLPASKIKIVDGEMFSWYGSRLLRLPAYLEQLKKDLI